MPKITEKIRVYPVIYYGPHGTRRVRLFSDRKTQRTFIRSLRKSAEPVACGPMAIHDTAEGVGK